MSTFSHNSRPCCSTVHRNIYTEHEIVVDGIHVLVVRKRVKNMNLRLSPDGKVHLSVPYGVGRTQIEAMVRKHRGWIMSNQHKMQKAAQRKAQSFAEGEKIYVWGKPHTIVYAAVAHGTLGSAPAKERPSVESGPVGTCPTRTAPAKKNPAGTTVTESTLSGALATPPRTGEQTMPVVESTQPSQPSQQDATDILYLPKPPSDLEGNSPESIEYRKQLVLEFFSPEVRREVERIYPSCAREVGAFASSITIRYMTTQWGSCTPSTRRIRINAALASYDPGCLRQVLIHELCHIHEANHSTRFWALMDEHCPDWRTWQAELKSRGPFDLPR